MSTRFYAVERSAFPTIYPLGEPRSRKRRNSAVALAEVLREMKDELSGSPGAALREVPQFWPKSFEAAEIIEERRVVSVDPSRVDDFSYDFSQAAGAVLLPRHAMSVSVITDSCAPNKIAIMMGTEGFPSSVAVFMAMAWSAANGCPDFAAGNSPDFPASA